MTRVAQALQRQDLLKAVRIWQLMIGGTLGIQQFGCIVWKTGP